MSAATRLTVGQALVRFLAAQKVERDGVRTRFFAGCFGIFGHGNVAGLGEALQRHADLLPYHPARNEQAMVHTAVAFARQRNRLAAFACTSSVGPGATNMVTGAALATINRLPVLLLPGDTFATRVPHPRPDGPLVIAIETDRYAPAPDGEGWWEVPVAEISDSEVVRAARQEYERGRQRQRTHL
jgi:TPP-dependent trihydroxycyclohexane-1,2-dione (THcHDO) dehydratase